MVQNTVYQIQLSKSGLVVIGLLAVAGLVLVIAHCWWPPLPGKLQCYTCRDPPRCTYTSVDLVECKDEDAGCESLIFQNRSIGFTDFYVGCRNTSREDHDELYRAAHRYLREMNFNETLLQGGVCLETLTSTHCVCRQSRCNSPDQVNDFPLVR